MKTAQFSDLHCLIKECLESAQNPEYCLEVREVSDAVAMRLLQHLREFGKGTTYIFNLSKDAKDLHDEILEKLGRKE